MSFAQPQDANWCIKNAQSIMWDNGAFSAYTKGKKFDVGSYTSWLDDKLCGSNWAVVPDVIGGGVDDQKELQSNWSYPDHLSCFVWHMDLPISWLIELVETKPRVAFGSSGKYWKVGNADWARRADEAWEAIDKTGARPWVHMMRGLKLSKERWPFASADSTNVARNFKNKGREKCPKEMCDRIDSIQTPLRFTLDLESTI